MMGRCEAVVVRYRPDPSAGEALNIGVILCAGEFGYVGARFVKSWRRITGAFPKTDTVHLRRMVRVFEEACERMRNEPLFRLDSAATVFGRVVPLDDASLIHSPPVTGVTANPDRTLRELFERYVSAPAETPSREARPDDQILKSVASVLRRYELTRHLHTRILTAPHIEQEFDLAWRNRRWNVAKPLSLDLLEPLPIIRKATDWTGRVMALDPEKQDADVHLVLGVPSASAPPSVRSASDDAIAILEDQLVARGLAELTFEFDADRLAERIQTDVKHRKEDADEIDDS